MAEVGELKAFVTASPNEADFSSAATKREAPIRTNNDALERSMLQRIVA